MKNTSTQPSQNGTKKQTNENGLKAKPDAAQGLHNLFVNELKDIYWSEKALTKAITKMIKNATSQELVEALTGHLQVTKEQVIRLEEVFSSIGEKAGAKKCEAMTDIIKEVEEIMKETEKGTVRDAGIILSGQKVEHYEIASYGSLCSFAKTLGEVDAAALLEETLNEEKEADEKLSEIAESSISIETTDENYGDTMVEVKTKRM